MEQSSQVRFAVYDSHGSLLGYKSDSFWTLDEEKYAKYHNLQNALSSDHLEKNLAGLSNRSVWWQRNSKKFLESKFDDKCALYIAAEDSLTGKGVFGYVIKRNSEGNYTLEGKKAAA